MNGVRGVVRFLLIVLCAVCMVLWTANVFAGAAAFFALASLPDLRPAK